MSRKKALITGGAGFIGSHVADRFLAEGYAVWILDDLSSGKRENVPSGATFVQGDIRGTAVDDVFREAGGFDVVCHHAAQIDVRISVADPRRDASINVDGFLNVIEAARTHGCGRFVFVSSGGVVYGEPEVRPTPETAPKLPLSPYGVTKLVAEQYLHYYRVTHGMQTVALRYSNVYGPRQDPHGEAGVVAIFSNRLRDGEPVTIFGDGEQTRDYVYVGDVAAANYLVATVPLEAIERTLPNPKGAEALDVYAFNVGTSMETSVNELARLLMQASGRTVEVRHAPARPGEVQHSCIATDKLQSLGWQCAVTIEEGLGRTYRHIAGQEVAR